MDPLKLFEWLDRQPAWRRHVLTGAGFVLIARGAWLGIPLIGVILVAVEGMAGVVVFGQLLLLVAAFVAGGALSGAMYTVLGSRLKEAPVIGPSLAGIVVGLPYFAVVCGSLYVIDAEVRAVSLREMLLVSGLISVLLGVVFGWIFFRD